MNVNIYLEKTIDSITEDGLKKSTSNLVPKNNIIVCTRMGLGKIVINKIDVAINQDLRALILPSLIDQMFFFHKYKNYDIQGTGVTVKGIRLDELLNFLFPLPPLAEQRRIVAKIDELMGRCDELEKLRSDRTQKQITVHTAALDRLLKATEQNDFNTAWQFLTQHFSELYSTKANLTELRKAILQLAVMGKLVPQDSSDRPASELLKEIEKEKEKLIKEGKIKKSKPLPEIKPDEIPYDLPKGWEWMRLGEISIFENGDRSNRYPNESDHQASGIPFFGAKDMVSGLLRFDNGLRFISESKFLELSNGKLVDRDFVILLRGTVGKIAIFRVNSEFSTGFINAQMLIVRMIDKALCDFFLSTGQKRVEGCKKR